MIGTGFGSQPWISLHFKYRSFRSKYIYKGFISTVDFSHPCLLRLATFDLLKVGFADRMPTTRVLDDHELWTSTKEVTFLINNSCMPRHLYIMRIAFFVSRKCSDARTLQFFVYE